MTQCKASQNNGVERRNGSFPRVNHEAMEVGEIRFAASQLKITSSSIVTAG